ncbi:MAG: hypothetical protein ACREQF_10650 [Candidatus Binataceae bacterium]
MAVTVKKATLWRKEVENRPGALATTLEPLANAGADLKVVMGYRRPGSESRAAIEVHPISGKRVTEAATNAGLSASGIPALIVEGENRAGLGHAIAEALGAAGINLTFVLAQVVGRRYSAVFGFENEADARRAPAAIKQASTQKR